MIRFLQSHTSNPGTSCPVDEVKNNSFNTVFDHGIQEVVNVSFTNQVTCEHQGNSSQDTTQEDLSHAHALEAVASVVATGVTLEPAVDVIFSNTLDNEQKHSHSLTSSESRLDKQVNSIKPEAMGMFLTYLLR